MARPKKVFTKHETWWALEYIDRKFKLDRDWPREDWSWNYDAHKRFEKLKGGEPLPLHDWCSNHLDPEQLQQLFTALRARKKRSRVETPQKSLTLTWNAWLYLSELAKRDKVTISQFLTDRLEQEYYQLQQKEDEKGS